MANEKRLIAENDIYALFEKNGTAKLHVADIDVLPRVDAVEVVHGRWENANDGTHFCSNCGCDATYTWDDIDRSFINLADDVPDRNTNYCPNCGAKMDGERIEGE